MRVTLKGGGVLSFGHPTKGRIRMIPGQTEDVPPGVAGRYAHRFVVHDEPDAPDQLSPEAVPVVNPEDHKRKRKRK